MSGLSEVILETRALTVARDGRDLLNDVSVAIRGGGSVAIIGPNGAGKTTLLKAMAGLVTGTEDAVFFLGKPLSAYSRRDLARLIAFVPQLSEQLPPIAVRDFVLLARYDHGNRWFGASDKADHLATSHSLEFVGISGFSQRDITTLSGGERQKVLIAAALVQDAPLLLLDEPAAFLDYRQAIEVQNLLELVRKEKGKTIISVVHDLNQGALEGSWVIALNHGRVVFQGGPQTLTKPETLHQIYETEFEVIRPSGTGRPLIAPLRGAK